MEFELWENENKVCYAGDFIKDQSSIVALKITTLLEDISKFDFLVLLRKEKVKKIEKEIYEIRFKIQRDPYRFLFVIRKNKGWIVEAFKKKTNKTPRKYIDNAKNRISSLDQQLK